MTFDLAQMIAKLRDPELIVSRTNAAAAEIIRLTARVAELEGALSRIIEIDHHHIYDGPAPTYVRVARATLSTPTEEPKT